MAVVWGTPLGHAVTKGTSWAVESCSPGTTSWTVRVSGVTMANQAGRAEGGGSTTGAQVSWPPGDSDDSCDTVILSPTARAVRNVRNVMYLHQEGEEEEEEEEEEDDGEEIEQEHEGKKVVVSGVGLGLD